MRFRAGCRRGCAISTDRQVITDFEAFSDVASYAIQVSVERERAEKDSASR